jgi:hypothetical protein
MKEGRLVPAVIGNLGDGIDLVDEEAPEGFEIGRTGETAGGADYRNRFSTGNLVAKAKIVS